MDRLPFRPGYEIFEPVKTNITHYYPNGPEVILREMMEETYFEDPFIFSQRTKAAHEQLQLFGIHVLPYSFVVTEKPSKLVLVGDFIHGNSYENEEYDSMPENHRLLADGLLSNLFSYLYNSIENGSERLGDVYGLHQYMFTESSCILTDMGIFFHGAREKTRYSIEHDIMDIHHFAESGCIMLKNHDIKKESFLRNVRSLIYLSASKNNIVINEEDINDFFEELTENENFSSEVFLYKLLQRPENLHYKKEQTRLFPLARI